MNPRALTRYKDGVALQGGGDLTAAARAYEEATRLHRGFAEAWSNLGNVYWALGRREDALRAYRAAIRANAKFAAVYCNLGALLIDLEHYEEAARTLEIATRLAPQLPEAFANLGQALRREKKYEAAIAACRKAIELRPDYRDAYLNLAIAAQAVDALEESLAANARAVEIDPASALGFCNLGGTLHALGRYGEAIAAADRAIALRPDYAEAHANRALTLLLTGDFTRGWAEYEWTWRVPSNRGSYPYLDRFPRWDGAPFPGRHLLVTREQGFGDAILMARYLPLVKALGGTVALEVPAPLASLFARCAGVDDLRTVADVAMPRQDIDLHIPLMGLPRALRTGVGNVPAQVPYLFPDPAKVERWSARLASPARLRVGIAWAGNPNQVDDRHRSCSLAQFSVLAGRDDVAWFGLQKGRDETLRESGRLKLDPLGGEIEDFSDTAAILSLLDLVVTVDTSVAHLAGALGRPAWVLVPFVPHWSYLLERRDSVWYPTMRLFRQPRAGDWASAFADVSRELGALGG